MALQDSRRSNGGGPVGEQESGCCQLANDEVLGVHLLTRLGFGEEVLENVGSGVRSAGAAELMKVGMKQLDQTLAIVPGPRLVKFALERPQCGKNRVVRHVQPMPERTCDLFESALMRPCTSGPNDRRRAA